VIHMGCYLNTIMIATLSLVLTGCGQPDLSYEEKQKLHEIERQEAISNARKELVLFAKEYGATAMEPFFGSTLSLENKYSIEFQSKYEGKDVVFRSEAIDISRNSAGVAEVVFVNRLISSTTFYLTATDEMIKKIKDGNKSKFSSALVVAHIDKITPMQLEARACGDEDCNEVSIETPLFGRSYQIRGRLIDYVIGKPET